jgi:hypothetical protein
MIGVELTRITAPASTYGWLVRAADIMLDVVVRDGVLQRLDRSTGFESLHTNDLKRLATLRINDMLRILDLREKEVCIQSLTVDIPRSTYDQLVSDDFTEQQTGFNDLMVWVGRELST